MNHDHSDKTAGKAVQPIKLSRGTRVAPEGAKPARREPVASGETIDLTPCWGGILPALLSVLEGGTDEANKRLIRTELQRMAEAADKWNAHCKASKG